MQITQEKIFQKFFMTEYEYCTNLTTDIMLKNEKQCHVQKIMNLNQIIQINRSDNITST